MSNFPTSLDDGTTLPEPTSGSAIPASADTNRSQAIKALETKVGINDSTPSDATVLKGTGAGESDWGKVDVDELSATGTASSSTFLRGDGQWAAPAGGGGGDLLAANNLSDVANAATSLSNLGGEPAKGADDNYVTDAEKVVIGNTSGTNTGDQDISGIATNASAITALEAEQDTQDAAIAAAANYDAVTQAEAEAGTSTDLKSWTPERVAQAIAALASGGGGGGGSSTDRFHMPWLADSSISAPFTTSTSGSGANVTVTSGGDNAWLLAGPNGTNVGFTNLYCEGYRKTNDYDGHNWLDHDPSMTVLLGTGIFAVGDPDHTVLFGMGGTRAQGGGKGTTKFIGFYFDHDATSGVTTMNAYNCDGASETTTAFTVPTGWTDANSNNGFRFHWRRTGNEVKFYASGTLVATHTTNLPTGDFSDDLIGGIFINKTTASDGWPYYRYYGADLAINAHD